VNKTHKPTSDIKQKVFSGRDDSIFKVCGVFWIDFDFLTQDLRIAPRLARFVNIKPPKAAEM
jgi:hypothetical protein